jgi:carboxypeptidase Taq
MTDAYAELVAQSKDLAVLQSCSAVLGWDQQTYMPKAGAAFRGEQLALLAKLCHQRLTDPRRGELLAAVEASDVMSDAESAEAANVREWRREYDRATKLPSRLVEELARVTTAAQEAWVEARTKSDFALFRPHLEAILKLKREEATHCRLKIDDLGLKEGPHPVSSNLQSSIQNFQLYDALLDEYEPGVTAAELKVLFAELTKELVPLVLAVADSPSKPDTSVLTREFDVDRQRWFAESAAAAIGFDFHAGRLDKTAHPFCSAFGPGDCRLTTRYNPRFFNEAFFGVLHEAGHGMYEQGLPTDRFGSPCGAYCSLGIHESQSRLWENQVGRSRPFWEHFLPRLKQAFPGTLDDVTLDGFVSAVNAVRPSLIRVEADEATYNLHIAVRFEVELALLSGDLSVADLPGAWNDRYEAVLGVRPTTDRDGCLQDIHWSFGGLGYFPTYTLGNLYAAQFMRRIHADVPDLDRATAAGGFSDILAWLRSRVHVHGRKHRASELCRRATGAPLSAAAFTSYLKQKIQDLYGVC